MSDYDQRSHGSESSYADASVRGWRSGRYGVVEGHSSPDEGVPMNPIDAELSSTIDELSNLTLLDRIEIYEASDTPDHVVEHIEHFIHMERVRQTTRRLACQGF